MRCVQEHNNLEDAQMRLIVDEMSKGLNLDHTCAPSAGQASYG